MSERIAHTRAVQLALAAALVVMAGASVAPPPASAGLYHVLQCHSAWRAANELVPVDNNDRYEARTTTCGGADARAEVWNSGFGVNGQGAWIAFNAPPGTGITEVHVDANLRRANHHQSQIALWNGSNNVVIANGPDSNPQWIGYHLGRYAPHPAAVFLVQCQNAGGCADSGGVAHLYARNFNFQLDDPYAPATPSVGGSLTSGGWLRGAHSFVASSSDYGSGILRVDALVNGQAFAIDQGCNNGGLSWPNTGYSVPCPGSRSVNAPSVNTTAGPFQNGTNVIRTAAQDWSGNWGGFNEFTIKVDNENPAVAFPNAQDPEDPELIRAAVADQFSGVASAKLLMRKVGATDWTTLESKVEGGEVRARVDSASLPAGEYEFRAVATDVAGNTTETTKRANGDAMKLSFPLRAPVHLQAHLGDGGGKGQTVPYGTDSKVAGRLLNEKGEPIAGKEVLIDENFGAGALIRHRPTTVTTDNEGRFETDIPAGPTRRVTATFPGSTKYASADTNVGEFTVKSRAKFTVADKTVREGTAATFKGKVGHFGARIPASGKLVELQVRLKTGRWDTVGQAFRTNEKGRYKKVYRFGKHYTQDALFRFRVKVQKESNWPYKRAASKQRKVIVKAR